MLTQDQIDEWDSTQDESTPDKTPMEMVEEFRRVMDQEKDPAMAENLIFEEYQEWVDSRPMYANEDHVTKFYKEKELKELADLVYTIFGYANARGWDLDEALRRVHKNNIERCIQPDGSIKRRADGKILKRVDYPKVDLSDLTVT